MHINVAIVKKKSYNGKKSSENETWICSNIKLVQLCFELEGCVSVDVCF